MDLYYAHLDDPVTPQEETLAAFAGLVNSRQVAVLGASNHTLARLASARELSASHGWPGYQVIQQRHSYLTPADEEQLLPQRVVTAELLEYAANQPDLLVCGYSPLLQGAYSRTDRPVPDPYVCPDTTARLARLVAVSDRLGLSINRLVLAWMLAGHPPVIPVLGVSTVRQLDEAMDAVEFYLTEDVRAELDA